LTTDKIYISGRQLGLDIAKFVDNPDEIRFILNELGADDLQHTGPIMPRNWQNNLYLIFYSQDQKIGHGIIADRFILYQKKWWLSPRPVMDMIIKTLKLSVE